MNLHIARAFVLALLGLFATVPASTAPVSDRPPTPCAPDSPERRGEEGCTILASRPFVGSAAKTVYWHIDRLDSLSAAEQAAGPNGVAAEAHGAVWLMTVENSRNGSHRGRHVARVGPIALPMADRFTMRVLSTLLMPGGRTPVHTHPGPEVFHVFSGEQCVETEAVAHRLTTGNSFVLPTETIHRGKVMGTVPRRALALVLHDAGRPGSHDLAAPPQLTGCL